MLVATESGLCLWLQRMACACGYGEWLVLVATESGLCLWLSCQHVRVAFFSLRKLSSPRRLVVCDFNFSLTLQLTYEP